MAEITTASEPINEQPIAPEPGPSNGDRPGRARPDQDRNWKNLRVRAENAERELAELRKGKGVYAKADVDEAYQRGWNEAESWAAFKDRLAASREKYGRVEPDGQFAIDVAMEALRAVPIPDVVTKDITDLPDGLDAAYLLSKNKALCVELGATDPARARQRFRDFLNDMLFALGRGKAI